MTKVREMLLLLSYSVDYVPKFLFSLASEVELTTQTVYYPGHQFMWPTKIFILKQHVFHHRIPIEWKLYIFKIRDQELPVSLFYI